MRVHDVAADFAIAAHDSIGQVRKYTGEPYWHHPREVALLVQRAGLSHQAIAAAWLHDVLEDVAPKRPEFGPEAIRRACGDRVLELVLEVTDVSRPQDGNRATRKALDREHFAKASAEGQGVKLADLIENGRDIAAHDPDFARTYLVEAEALLCRLTAGPADLRELLAQTLFQANLAIRGIR